jgi:hypothetical protein
LYEGLLEMDKGFLNKNSASMVSKSVASTGVQFDGTKSVTMDNSNGSKKPQHEPNVDD